MYRAHRSHLPRLLAAALVVAPLAACTIEQGDGAVGVPATDPTSFRAKAYPVLLERCAYPGCHGNPDRFLVIYGPGRARLKATTAPYDPPTPDELAISYTRAQSMLVSTTGVRASNLLRKPLEPDAGGAGHKGNDAWGYNVFADTKDPGYAALLAWATSKGAP